MIPRRSVTNVKAAITGNVTDQNVVSEKTSIPYGGPGIDLGGRIVLGTATTVDVTVKDSDGKVLYSATGITTNVSIDGTGNGIKGPLLVTTANISNAAHTLTIYWKVKK